MTVAIAPLAPTARQEHDILILLQTFASSLCATHSLLLLFCAVRRLAGHVDDLECFYHLFLPGGWRSVQGKKQKKKHTFSWINSASVSN